MKRIFSILLLGIFMLSACGTLIQLPTTPSIAPSTETVTPTATAKVEPQSSSSQAHVEASKTPAPTFSAQEKDEIISHLLTQDFQCRLPCWGEIEPGATTLSETLNFLGQFANVRASNNSAEMNYEGETIFVYYYVKNETLEFIMAPRYQYPLYRLLQDYGKPDEIYFFVLDVLPIDTANPYTVYLFYRDAGIIAEYDGSSPKGENISVCFKDRKGQPSRNVLLSLWTNRSDKSFNDVIDQYRSIFFPGSSSLIYYKLEELSTYTVNDFFETYKLDTNQNECLKIHNPNNTP